MKTAKDIAFKAYVHGMLVAYPDKTSPQIKEHFENWWSEWYGRQDHKDSFHVELSVFIEGKRYIQAE